MCEWACHHAHTCAPRAWLWTLQSQWHGCQVPQDDKQSSRLQMRTCSKEGKNLRERQNPDFNTKTYFKCFIPWLETSNDVNVDQAGFYRTSSLVEFNNVAFVFWVNWWRTGDQQSDTEFALGVLVERIERTEEAPVSRASVPRESQRGLVQQGQWRGATCHEGHTCGHTT